MSNLLDVHTFERRLNLLLDELAERRTIPVTGETASMDTSNINLITEFLSAKQHDPIAPSPSSASRK